MMLRVTNLEAAYGASQVLFGVSLEVNDGEVVTLLGRNGMGKTTTINTIMGIVKAAGGEVIFDDVAIAGSASYRIAQRAGITASALSHGERRQLEIAMALGTA